MPVLTIRANAAFLSLTKCINEGESETFKQQMAIYSCDPPYNQFEIYILSLRLAVDRFRENKDEHHKTIAHYIIEQCQLLWVKNNANEHFYAWIREAIIYLSADMDFFEKFDDIVSFEKSPDLLLYAMRSNDMDFLKLLLKYANNRDFLRKPLPQAIPRLLPSSSSSDAQVLRLPLLYHYLLCISSSLNQNLKTQKKVIHLLCGENEKNQADVKTLESLFSYPIFYPLMRDGDIELIKELFLIASATETGLKTLVFKVLELSVKEKRLAVVNLILQTEAINQYYEKTSQYSLISLALRHTEDFSFKKSIIKANRGIISRLCRASNLKNPMAFEISLGDIGVAVLLHDENLTDSNRRFARQAYITRIKELLDRGQSVSEQSDFKQLFKLLFFKKDIPEIAFFFTENAIKKVFFEILEWHSEKNDGKAIRKMLFEFLQAQVEEKESCRLSIKTDAFFDIFKVRNQAVVPIFCDIILKEGFLISDERLCQLEKLKNSKNGDVIFRENIDSMLALFKRYPLVKKTSDLKALLYAKSIDWDVVNAAAVGLGGHATALEMLVEVQQPPERLIAVDFYRYFFKEIGAASDFDGSFPPTLEETEYLSVFVKMLQKMAHYSDNSAYFYSDIRVISSGHRTEFLLKAACHETPPTRAAKYLFLRVLPERSSWNSELKDTSFVEKVCDFMLFLNETEVFDLLRKQSQASFLILWKVFKNKNTLSSDKVLELLMAQKCVDVFLQDHIENVKDKSKLSNGFLEKAIQSSENIPIVVREALLRKTFWQERGESYCVSLFKKTAHCFSEKELVEIINVNKEVFLKEKALSSDIPNSFVLKLINDKKYEEAAHFYAARGGVLIRETSASGVTVPEGKFFRFLACMANDADIRENIKRNFTFSLSETGFLQDLLAPHYTSKESKNGASQAAKNKSKEFGQNPMRVMCLYLLSASQTLAEHIEAIDFSLAGIHAVWQETKKQPENSGVLTHLLLKAMDIDCEERNRTEISQGLRNLILDFDFSNLNQEEKLLFFKKIANKNNHALFWFFMNNKKQSILDLFVIENEAASKYFDQEDEKMSALYRLFFESRNSRLLALYFLPSVTEKDILSLGIDIVDFLKFVSPAQADSLSDSIKELVFKKIIMGDSKASDFSDAVIGAARKYCLGKLFSFLKFCDEKSDLKNKKSVVLDNLKYAFQELAIDVNLITSNENCRFECFSDWLKKYLVVWNKFILFLSITTGRDYDKYFRVFLEAHPHGEGREFYPGFISDFSYFVKYFLQYGGIQSAFLSGSTVDVMWKRFLAIKKSKRDFNDIVLKENDIDIVFLLKFGAEMEFYANWLIEWIKNTGFFKQDIKVKFSIDAWPRYCNIRAGLWDFSIVEQLPALTTSFSFRVNYTPGPDFGNFVYYRKDEKDTLAMTFCKQEFYCNREANGFKHYYNNVFYSNITDKLHPIAFGFYKFVLKTTLRFLAENFSEENQSAFFSCFLSLQKPIQEQIIAEYINSVFWYLSVPYREAILKAAKTISIPNTTHTLRDLFESMLLAPTPAPMAASTLISISTSTFNAGLPQSATQTFVDKEPVMA